MDELLWLCNVVDGFHSILEKCIDLEVLPVLLTRVLLGLGLGTKEHGAHHHTLLARVVVEVVHTLAHCNEKALVVPY